jgi:hypothetical protein
MILVYVVYRKCHYCDEKWLHGVVSSEAAAQAWVAENPDRNDIESRYMEFTLDEPRAVDEEDY